MGVLCYHAVSPTWPAPLSVTPEQLNWQLTTLLERGYEGLKLGELARRSDSRRAFAVTFDDAYRSVIALALPILERLGLKATVFAPSAFIDTGRPMRWPGIDQWIGTEHEHELMPMSWDELGELDRRGWEIGSHTRTHKRLPEIGDDALRAELLGSRYECEDTLGIPCEVLAYPYGDHDDRVVATAQSAGYAAAVTLPARMHEPSPLRIPRIGIYHGDGHGRFRLKLSPSVQGLRGGPLWPARQARPAGRRGRSARWRPRTPWPEAPAAQRAGDPIAGA